MFKGPGKIVQDNKSSSYPVFELTGVNCKNILDLRFYVGLLVNVIAIKLYSRKDIFKHMHV